MKSTAIDGLYYWSSWQPDRRIDFNGYYWKRKGGGVMVDPIALVEGSQVEEPVRWILMTNADHVRAAPAMREKFGAKLLAPATDRARLKDVPVDAWFGPDGSGADEPLPKELRDDVEVRWVRGGKTDAEAVFYLAPLRALVVGDAVRSHVSGVLRLLPDEKLVDRAAVVRDVAALTELNFQALLLGDGDPVFVGAKGAFLAFVRGLGGA